MATTGPTYRVVVRAFLNTTTYAPGAIVADLQNVKNVGWAYYVNDVPEAFFTLNQDDPKTAAISDYLNGEGIVQIYRNGTLVWAGLLLESDETEVDVIFYAYGWACILYWLHTDWAQEWTAKQVDEIFTDLLVRAVSGLTDSLAGWWTEGTIQAPVTTSGGGTAIVLPSYKTYRKRILIAVRELVAVSGSDTTNRVWWEVTPAGVYNLWKNKGLDLDSLKLEYPGNVTSFQRLRIPAHRRNVLYGIGSNPRDVVLQTTQESAGDRDARGRREEAIYLSYVRDATELERTTRRRMRRARRVESHTRLRLRRNSVDPYPVGDYSLMDTIPVRIDKGVTQLDDSYLIVGQEVYVIDGEERVVPLIQDKLT